MSDVKLSDKAKGKLNSLVELAMQATRANPSETGMAVQNAINAMYRIVRQAEVPAEMERFSWVGTVGPIHEFTGTIVYAEEYTDKDGNFLVLDLARTQSGKLVLAQERHSMGKETILVNVFEAGDYIGVMDACRWSDMARTMAKKLKWPLIVEVE